MDLGSVFSSVVGKTVGRKETPESFLAIKISSTAVLATVWSIFSGKVTIGEVAAAEIEEKTSDGLLAACDRAVSEAAKADEEVTKAVLALPFTWVAEGKIVAERLKELRFLCKSLDLQPQGFVVLTEALENYFREVEGAPLTAILVGIDGEESTLTMYRAGKNLGTAPLKISGRGEAGSVVGSMVAALSRFSEAEVFPSRIILYDGRVELEGMVDEITSYQWTKELPFLHFPKVEVIPAEVVVKAVAVAGGLQLGAKFEVGDEGESGEKVAREFEEVVMEEAGFSFDNDVSGGSKERVTGKEGLGQLMEMEEIAALPAIPGRVVRERLASLGRSLLSTGKGLWGRVRHVIVLPEKTLRWHGGKRLFFWGLGVVGLGVAAILVLSSTVQAVLIVRVAGKEFDRNLEVTVVTSEAKVATGAAVLSGSFVEVREVGTKRGVATGHKLVGDKAKGVATVYSSSAARTFPSGTIISSVDGLKFTLDQEVAVASASNFLSPATAAAAVTAADIGEKYNLSAGTIFSVGGLSSSSYLAKNESPFSAGSSHQATVVTLEDQNRLVATLSAELGERAKTDLELKLSFGQKLLPKAITAAVVKKKFSKDLDAEADTFSLDLNVDFRGVVFSQEDLVGLFSRRFSQDIPAGFILHRDEANVVVQSAREDKSGSTVLDARVSGRLQPEIDVGELARKLAGKSLSAARQIVGERAGVTGLTVEAKPRFLSFVVRTLLPWRAENISVELVVD